MSEIKKIGSFSFVDTAAGQYAINMDWSQSMSQFFNAGSQDWDGDPVSVAGVRVVPWGPDNNMPNAIRDLLEKNNLGPGILDRKVGLLYGQGPMLYRVKIENNERIQEWMEDAEIQEWLDSWDYKGYIRDNLVEYTHMNGHFTKYYMGKGVRIGRPWVQRLESLHSEESRLVWPENDSRRLEDVTEYLTGDFDSFKSRTFRKYPAFDKWNPTRYETAIKYHCMRSFGRSMYAISCFYGSVPWLENANNLPEIIKHLNENMIAAAYVVHSPQEYWNQKHELIMAMHEDWDETKIQKEMERLTLTMKHAATYRQLRPMYGQYRQSRDKEKFLRGHESEIILFKTAARKLKRLGAVPLPAVQRLRAEMDVLRARRTALQSEYRKAQREEREYDTLRQNVEALLEKPREAEPQRQRNNELE